MTGTSIEETPIVTESIYNNHHLSPNEPQPLAQRLLKPTMKLSPAETVTPVAVTVIELSVVARLVRAAAAEAIRVAGDCMHLFPAFDPSDFGFGTVYNHCPISSRGSLQGIVSWSHYDYVALQIDAQRAKESREEAEEKNNARGTAGRQYWVPPVVLSLPVPSHRRVASSSLTRCRLFAARPSSG
jgi:hypothetical protein